MSKTLRRLFVALPLSDEWKEMIAAYCNENNLSYVRYVPSENLHVTVLFLGEIDYVPSLDIALREVSETMAPISLTLNKVAYGPPGREARMIWMYFDGGEGFQKLVRECIVEITKVLPNLSFRADALPHITLARFKRHEYPKELIPLTEVPEPGKILIVSEMLLMQSFLAASGAEYTALNRFPFSRSSFLV